MQRGSLLECFKKNKILSTKRGRNSAGSILDSDSGETVVTKGCHHNLPRLPLAEIRSNPIAV